MNRRSFALLGLLAVLAVPGQARAEEDVLEKVVVRNRLFKVAGRLEASANFGLMPVTWLTEHYNLNAGVGFNLMDSLAVEARGGYAFTRHTGTAQRIAGMFLSRDPSQGAQQTVDDFSNLWEMNGNLVLGLRWQPIYGKLSLLAERPVHFQAYVWAGGGVGSFKRESIVYCMSVDRTVAVNCNDWLTESRVAGMGSGAIGMRFFANQSGALTLEVRDYVYPDRYRLGIDRLAAEAGDRSSGRDGSRGFANLVLIDLGYTYLF